MKPRRNRAVRKACSGCVASATLRSFTERKDAYCIQLQLSTPKQNKILTRFCLKDTVVFALYVAYPSDLYVMEHLRQRVDKLPARYKRVYPNASLPPKGTDPKSRGDAVYNKHLCQMCTQAVDYVWGVPFPNSAITHDNSVTLQHSRLPDNTRRLQDSVEEGCYMCTAIRNYLLGTGGQGPHSTRDIRLHSYGLNKDKAGSITEIDWVIDHAYVRLYSLMLGVG